MTTSYHSLSKPWKRLFLLGRFVLISIFLIGGAFFSFSVLFPPQSFFFDFHNSKAQNNTLVRPRNLAGESRDNGRIAQQETLVVNASAFGEYSTLDIFLAGEDDAEPLTNGAVSVRRSQQAFLYPEGDPAPFPDGSLLREGERFYHVAPNGTLKQFPSEDAVRNIGYDPSTFLPVSPEDLRFQRNGGIVSVASNTLPEGAFVRSDGTYYLWNNGKLIPFVSPAAFLARFPDSWALPQDISFVNERALSDEWIGFPSGSALAWGNGAFLMDGKIPRAILGVDIFLSLGYSWKDVVSVSNEEISLEQKGKPVDFGTPHPNETVFLDTKENTYYLILEGKKREIRSEKIRTLWLGNRDPIPVSSDSLTSTASCQLLEDISPFSSYALSCSVPIESLDSLPGDTYEIAVSLPKETNIRRMDASFKTTVNHNNLFLRLSQLKNRALSRYFPTP